jgi:hypothetical protein
MPKPKPLGLITKPKLPHLPLLIYMGICRHMLPLLPDMLMAIDILVTIAFTTSHYYLYY